MKHQEHKQKSNSSSVVLAVICFLLTALMLICLLHTGRTEQVTANNGKTTETFDQELTNLLSTELGGNAETISQTLTLQDSDLIAPIPDPNCFGTAASPEEMADILKAAESKLNLSSPLFTTETPIKEGSTIQYYLDDTIYAVTWKQTVNRGTYTFSEVKIAHPSQFRRFLSEGTYNSGILLRPTEMASSVNAVTASAGDYYSYRHFGIVVNNGIVYRSNGQLLDTCYIDDNGDLLFTFAREIDGKEAVQSYVDDHNIRFSLSFGPVMLFNGQNMVPKTYNSGEINQTFPRAALCQIDALHYVLVCANEEKPDYQLPTVSMFAESLAELGIPTAYALDGGQTASIVFNNRLINTVSYGSQRKISDIIYFATAAGQEQ